MAQATHEVAALVDPYGGWSVVVSDTGFDAHVRPGVVALVLPDLKVACPVPWDAIPTVVEWARQYIDWWIRTRNDPDDLAHDAIRLYQIRKLRAFQKDTLHLSEICET